MLYSHIVFTKSKVLLMASDPIPWGNTFYIWYHFRPLNLSTNYSFALMNAFILYSVY